jgi:hypothetical protein
MKNGNNDGMKQYILYAFLDDHNGTVKYDRNSQAKEALGR